MMYKQIRLWLDRESKVEKASENTSELVFVQCAYLAFSPLN